jgi:hypothetical protein
MNGILRIFIVLAGISIFFLLLGLLSQNLEKTIQVLPLEEQAKINATIQNQNTESLQEKVFRSLNNEIEVTYSPQWIDVPTNTSTLGNEESYTSTTLLRATKFTLEGTSAQLIITELSTSGKTIDEILQDMQKNNSETGWNMEILSSAQEKTQSTFDIEYTKEMATLRSKEKIVQINTEIEKTYIIAIISNSSSWKEFEKEAESILDSVQTML